MWIEWWDQKREQEKLWESNEQELEQSGGKSRSQNQNGK